MTFDQAIPSATVHRVADGTVRVDVGGPIDLATVDTLTRALTEALDERPSAVAVSLKRVTVLDSTGIKTLLFAHRRARDESIGFTVVDASAIVVQVMQVLGIYDLLTEGAL